MKTRFTAPFWAWTQILLAPLLLAACYTREVPAIESAQDGQAFCPRAYDFSSYSYLSEIDLWGLVVPGPDGLWLSSRLDFPQVENSSALMRRFWLVWNEGMRARNVDYTVALVPQRGLLSNFEAFAPDDDPWIGNYRFSQSIAHYYRHIDTWPASGPRLVDLWPVLSAYGEEAYHQRDHHWTQGAAAVAAEYIAAELADAAPRQVLPIKNITVRAGNEINLSEAYQTVALRECGVRYVANRGLAYRSIGAGNSGFAKGTYVSLVGNSFINQRQGFEAHMRAALGTNVEEHHLSGHHMHWSMFNLVHNQMNVEDRAPAMAIQVLGPWEWGFDKIQGSHYELIAALNGACTANNAVASIAPILSENETYVWQISNLPRGDFYGQVNFRQRLRIEDKNLMFQRGNKPGDRAFEYVHLRNGATGRALAFTRTSLQPNHAMNTTLYLPLFSNKSESWEWLDQKRNPIGPGDRLYICRARFAL